MQRNKSKYPNIGYRYEIGGEVMYQVFKPTGAGANVSVENLDNMSNIIIGRLSTSMIDTLKENGYEVPDYNEEWRIEVNSECAKALAMMAMKMKKPIRDQSKKSKSTGKIGVEVDAFDLIFNI